jgi:hypothetical protein
MQQKKLYLAYGSNLNIAQMRYRCPTAKIVGTAVIENYELLYKGSKTGAYLTIEPKEGSQVPVGVWLVDKDCEVHLDRYEGYPDFYYKKDLTVKVKDFFKNEVRERKAFVYIMHEERELGIPSELYVRVCEEGYKLFGFDTAYLNQALKKSKEAF